MTVRVLVRTVRSCNAVWVYDKEVWFAGRATTRERNSGELQLGRQRIESLCSPVETAPHERPAQNTSGLRPIS